MKSESKQETRERTTGLRPAYVFGPLLLFTALSLLLTWPLATQFTTHVPGDGIDDPSLAWNLWWVKHALVDQPQNPFQVAWQFWPVGINLAFYTLTVLNGLLAIPLQAVFGVIPAYNLILLSSFVLSGFGAYLLCLEFLTRQTLRKRLARERACVFAAFLGGAFYAFASAKLFYAALGQGNIASSQWIPFALLYIVRAGRPAGRLRDAALAALFLGLQAYAELTYASFLALFVALVVIWRICETRPRADARGSRSLPNLLARMALLAILCAIGLAPILANMLPDLAAEGDFFTSGGGFADIFSADLAGYALPTQLHPLLGDLTRRVTNDSAPRPDGSHFPVNKGQQIYLGYTALLLMAAGLAGGRRRAIADAGHAIVADKNARSDDFSRAARHATNAHVSRAETWFWALAAGLFFLLTLGPSLRVAGHDLGAPLPFELVARLPFFKGNRYPSRYSVMLLACSAPLLAGGAAWLLEAASRSRRRPGRCSAALALGLLGLLLFEHLSAPLPLSDLRVPRLYDRIAAEPGDFAVLELPPGWRNGARVAGKQDIVIMQALWNQTAHGKRVLGGNTSRNPEFKFQFFSEDPTLARLIATTNAADLPQHDALRAYLAGHPVTPAEAARARAWAATWSIRYVMVHRDKLPAATEAALHALLPTALVAEDGALALYRIANEDAPPDHFAVGADAGRMILAEGWSSPGFGAAVYAQRQEARLLLPLGAAARELRLEMWALAAGQEATLFVDGRRVGAAPVAAQRQIITFALPPDPARPPLSDVRLRFVALVPVAQAAGQTPLASPGLALPVSLLARSGGQEVGDFAHIYVNGVDHSPNRRGYNLAALSAADGRVLSVAAFDTHADAAASRRLADWVAGLPAGTIVAGAIRDEASLNLGQDAVDALRTLGATSDLRQHFRWSHAFIGIVGRPPGVAREEASGVRPGQVAVGLSATAPQVAAALVGVQVVK